MLRRPQHGRAPPDRKGTSSRPSFVSSKKRSNKIRKRVPLQTTHKQQDEEGISDEVEEQNLSSNEDENFSSDDGDADVARTLQWVDDDDDFGVLQEETKEEGSEAGALSLKKLRGNLSNLPFGALRKAQSALDHTEVATDPETDGDDSASENLDGAKAGNLSAEQQGEKWGTKSCKKVVKRSNKHAPMEVTSKKPVTRFRQVVEVKKLESRDPRFLPVSGELKADKFHQNYNFLTQFHVDELNTLRDNLKRAKKMLNNAPRHLRDDYEAEVRRLDLAMKRTESVVNRERLERIQREALQKISKEEKERQSRGKGSWFLKKTKKHEIVTRARYEALAAEGGNRAVKKAIEKKQKKIGQKEKKNRPFSKGGPAGEEGRKRPAVSEYSPRKRRKVG